jgi:hypothetical protein
MDLIFRSFGRFKNTKLRFSKTRSFGSKKPKFQFENPKFRFENPKKIFELETFVKILFRNASLAETRNFE